MQKTKQHGDQQRIRYLQRSVWRKVNLPRLTLMKFAFPITASTANSERSF